MVDVEKRTYKNKWYIRRITLQFDEDGTYIKFPDRFHRFSNFEFIRYLPIDSEDPIDFLTKHLARWKWFYRENRDLLSAESPSECQQLAFVHREDKWTNSESSGEKADFKVEEDSKCELLESHVGSDCEEKTAEAELEPELEPECEPCMELSIPDPKETQDKEKSLMEIEEPQSPTQRKPRPKKCQKCGLKLPSRAIKRKLNGNGNKNAIRLLVKLEGCCRCGLSDNELLS